MQTVDWIFAVQEEQDWAIVKARKVDGSYRIKLIGIVNLGSEYSVELNLQDAQTTRQYKDQRNKQDDNAWCQVLRYVFLGEVGGLDQEDYSNINVGMAVKAKELVLSVRQEFDEGASELDSIVIRLGNIKFDYVSNEAEYNPMTMIMSFSNKLRSINDKFQRESGDYEALQEQVQAIAREKKEFEKDILERVTLLLNEKKQMIRNLGGVGGPRGKRAREEGGDFEERETNAEEANNGNEINNEENGLSIDSDDATDESNEKSIRRDREEDEGSDVPTEDED